MSPDERKLFSTPEPIISTNTLVREDGHLIDPDDPCSTWPDKFLIIGMDIAGNFYCVNRELKRSTVFFWFHEDGEFERHAKNLTQFVDEVVTFYAGRR